MKKLLVSDYDKTLYLNDNNMKLNVISLNKFIELNNLFVVATGRSFQNFKDKVKEYNIPLNYIILNHGAVIVDNKYNIIKSEIINKDDLLNVLNYIKDNLDIVELLLYGMLENNKFVHDDIVKITIRFETRHKALLAYDELLKLYSNKFNIYLINSVSNRIEFISKKANKSIAIKKIIELENIDKSNVYTIGDSSNDLEMISDYNGYCMKDSEKEVYNVSNSIYDSVYLLIENILEK